MGIKGLSKLLADHAAGCCREQKYDNYFGRKIAIDASMHIYQALVVVGRTGDQTLTNEAGEVTRYVFDGKPPALKREELSRRLDKRTGADADLEKAKEVRCLPTMVCSYQSNRGKVKLRHVGRNSRSGKALVLEQASLA